MPGVSDLFLPVARHGYHGLFIEMKAAGKRRYKANQPTAEQQWFMESVREQGYLAVPCWGTDEAVILLSSYLSIDSSWENNMISISKSTEEDLAQVTANDIEHFDSLLRDRQNGVTVGELSGRLKGNLNTIYQYIRGQGCSCRVPAMRDIEKATGIPYTTVYYHVRRLEQIGLLERDGRHYFVVGAGVTVDDSTKVTKP